MMANNELEVVWSDRPWYNLRHNFYGGIEEKHQKSWLLGVHASIRTGHLPSKVFSVTKKCVISNETNDYLLLIVQFVGLNTV